LSTGIHRSVTPPSSPDSERMPWRRPVGATAASLGVPLSAGIFHPALGEAIAIIEIVIMLTIITTALFGSCTLSERAFRLLRWFGNRPEPPTPAGRR
jgi:hypothetical protein